MYQDRIRCTTPNRHPPFFIRHSDIAFDKRIAYIESVCATLIESRFGPGRVDPVIIDFSDRPELEPAVFYDLCDAEPNGLVPCYSLSPQGRAGFQVVEAAYRRAKQMGLVDAAPNARKPAAALTPIYPSNLGRGSPLLHKPAR